MTERNLFKKVGVGTPTFLNRMRLKLLHQDNLTVYNLKAVSLVGTTT